MASNRINCRIDKELERALAHFERGFVIRGRPATRSQAVREILRQAITSADPPTRGWHEGFAAGFAEAQEAFAQASGMVGAGAGRQAQPPPGRAPRNRK